MEPGVILLLLAGLGFCLYKMGLFPEFDAQQPTQSVTTPVDILSRIRTSLTELEWKRRSRRNRRLNYTSAQLSRMEDPPAPTWDMIGQPFAFDMRVDNASENGGVYLEAGDNWDNRAFASVTMPADYAFELSKRQPVRLQGVIVDGDYETFGNFPIWCAIGNASLDGIPALGPAQLATAWGPAGTPGRHSLSGLPEGGRGPPARQ